MEYARKSPRLTTCLPIVISSRMFLRRAIVLEAIRCDSRMQASTIGSSSSHAEMGTAPSFSSSVAEESESPR